MVKPGHRILVVCLLWTIASPHVFSDEKGHYSERAKGWYWHDEYKETPDDEDDQNAQVRMGPIEQLGAIRKEIETAQAKAVVYPTKENIEHFIHIQEQVAERAEQFERTWKAVLLERPDLDYSLKRPTNNIAKLIGLEQEKQKEEAAVRALAKQSGLFFFYRSSCPYCVRFAPIVKDFAETYGMALVPITTDGVALPEFPGSYRDQGQAKKFHVTVEPALFAVDPYTQQAFPIGYGLMSEADLKKRILDIATHFGGA